MTKKAPFPNEVDWSKQVKAWAKKLGLSEEDILKYAGNPQLLMQSEIKELQKEAKNEAKEHTKILKDILKELRKR
ncbi:hypothetical protein KAU92_03135 [Candidatus Bathyarchaeota archaeon]|nr:hypothetical protein [Candidatus Bathyarchaeota archaeon]